MASTYSKEVISEQNQANASHPHHTTPQKARIREAAFQLRTNGNWDGVHNLNVIFERHKVSKARGYAILSQHLESDCTFPRENNEVEIRGAKKKIL